MSTRLNPKIMAILLRKTNMEKNSISVALSRIREDHPSLTLNAAAQVFAKKRGFSVVRHLKDQDRESLKTIEVEKVRIPSVAHRQKTKIIEIAKYKTDDKLLKAHLDEINRAYTHACYTATFVLCRKVLENLIIHHILRRKYPENSKEHREKYFDFNNKRFLDFGKLLKNMWNYSNDYGPEKNLVERICQLADGFKETANEMTHSLYHVARKSEIDEKNFQQILDLIMKLEEPLQV